MPRTISHTPEPQEETVDIKRVYLRKSSNELVVKLSADWYSLSEEMKDKLFAEARSIYASRYAGKLKDGWTIDFTH